MADHTHLSDDLLNEYLDEALAPAARALADAHLAACAACNRRLATLQALFASLDALPEAALTRDLAPAVTRAIAPRPVPAPARRPWLGVVAALQVLVAVAVLAAAWPILAGSLAALALPAEARVVRDLLAALQALLAALDPAPVLAGWRAAAAEAAGALRPGALGLGPTAWLAAAAGAGLLWLFGHLWLLRGPAAPTSRRRG